MSSLLCSLCGKPAPREGNPYAPFCSERCQQLDLGRWLDERYGLPWEDPAKEAEPELDVSDNDDSHPSRP